MAVINDYVSSSLVSTNTGRRRVRAQNAQGSDLIHICTTFEVAAADDNASVYRLFPNIPSGAVMHSLRLACDAIANATDYDMGLYRPLSEGGAVVDKDILADGMDISAGYSRILALDALVSVDLADVNKKLYELSIGGTPYTVANAPPFFDICLTANTVGTAAGTITVFGAYWKP